MNHRKTWFVSLLAACPSIAAGQPGPMKVVVERAAMRELPATMRLVATVEPAVRSLIGADWVVSTGGSVPGG